MDILLKSRHKKKTALLCISEWIDTLKDLKCCGKRSSVDKPSCTCICFWYESQGPELRDWRQKWSFAALETGRWLLISRQNPLTSEETREFGMRMQESNLSPYSPGDRLSTTYPNNRAVGGDLCSSGWNQRSGQASDAPPQPPPVFWKTTDLHSYIHLTQQFAPNARRTQRNIVTF